MLCLPKKSSSTVRDWWVPSQPLVLSAQGFQLTLDMAAAIKTRDNSFQSQDFVDIHRDIFSKRVTGGEGGGRLFPMPRTWEHRKTSKLCMSWSSTTSMTKVVMTVCLRGRGRLTRRPGAGCEIGVARRGLLASSGAARRRTTRPSVSSATTGVEPWHCPGHHLNSMVCMFF